MKRILCCILTALCFALPSYAASERVSLYINGKAVYENEELLINNTTYVSVDSFLRAVGSSDSIEIYDDYISAKGRYIYTSAIEIEGKKYLPLRKIAALFDSTIRWDVGTNTAHVICDSPDIVSADDFYNADDLYWLSRIISSESEGEILKGKLAVGSVVLNRVDSETFPDSIYGVIFDNKYGVQFTPTANGRIYRDPTPESVIAAKMTLEGYRVSSDILYFIYEAIAENLWTVYNCDYQFTIGCHDFYA
ncbi:MAG: cell wall hydrolase [Clostridia bacterium]|nr:cell wall hydrolase [Clostridia bacterium]